LSGGIPTCLKNFTAMLGREIIKSGRIYKGHAMYDSNVLVMWKGKEHKDWNPENLLESIDLSSKDLTGEIPKELGYLHGLLSLNLSRTEKFPLVLGI